MGAWAVKGKLGARAGKYNLGDRANEYKLEAKDGVWDRESRPEPGLKQRISGWEIQRPKQKTQQRFQQSPLLILRYEPVNPALSKTEVLSC